MSTADLKARQKKLKALKEAKEKREKEKAEEAEKTPPETPKKLTIADYISEIKAIGREDVEEKKIEQPTIASTPTKKKLLNSIATFVGEINIPAKPKRPKLSQSAQAGEDEVVFNKNPESHIKKEANNSPQHFRVWIE